MSSPPEHVPAFLFYVTSSNTTLKLDVYRVWDRDVVKYRQSFQRNGCLATNKNGFRLPFVRTKSLVFITVYVVYFKCTKYMKQTCTVNSSWLIYSKCSNFSSWHLTDFKHSVFLEKKDRINICVNEKCNILHWKQLNLMKYLIGYVIRNSYLLFHVKVNNTIIW